MAQQRKTQRSSTPGASATTPGSVAGGLAAVRAVEVFFGGLPGGVVSRRTVTADAVTAGTAPKITLAIANDYGRVPAGNVSLVVKKGGATVASASAAVANDAASFTLPVLDAGTYDYTLSYAGDDQLAAFTETGSLTVAPAGRPRSWSPTPTPGATPAVVSEARRRRPRPRHEGQGEQGQGCRRQGADQQEGRQVQGDDHHAEGRATATGKVTIKLKKGKTTKTHHRQARARRGDRHGAEARQGHMEGHDLVAG